MEPGLLSEWLEGWAEFNGQLCWLRNVIKCWHTFVFRNVGILLFSGIVLLRVWVSGILWVTNTWPIGFVVKAVSLSQPEWKLDPMATSLLRCWMPKPQKVALPWKLNSKSYTLDIDNINTYRSKIECESTIDRTWRRGRICFAYPRAQSFASFDLWQSLTSIRLHHRKFTWLSEVEYFFIWHPTSIDLIACCLFEMRNYKLMCTYTIWHFDEYKRHELRYSAWRAIGRNVVEMMGKEMDAARAEQ